MWSSRFLWYTYRGCPLTVSQVSCALPWNHSSHSRSGGSLAVCALQRRQDHSFCTRSAQHTLAHQQDWVMSLSISHQPNA